jgi:hypothetical protein
VARPLVSETPVAQFARYYYSLWYPRHAATRNLQCFQAGTHLHIPRCARDDSRCKWSAKSTRHLQQKHKNLVPCVAANCGTSRSTYWWEEAHAPHKRTGQGTCGRGLTLSRRRTSRSRRSVCPEEAAFATDRRVVKPETSETAVSVDFQSKEPRSTPQRITVILRNKSAGRSVGGIDRRP